MRAPARQAVDANSDTPWNNFCALACAKPKWLADPRFATASSRLKNSDVLRRENQSRGGGQVAATR